MRSWPRKTPWKDTRESCWVRMTTWLRSWRDSSTLMKFSDSSLTEEVESFPCKRKTTLKSARLRRRSTRSDLDHLQESSSSTKYSTHLLRLQRLQQLLTTEAPVLREGTWAEALHWDLLTDLLTQSIERIGFKNSIGYKDKVEKITTFLPFWLTTYQIV